MEQFNKSKKSELFNALKRLRYARECGMVVKGLKETIRAIKSGKAKEVYVSKDPKIKDYIALIKEYCNFFKINCTQIDNWMDIRDAVIYDEPSTIIIERARIRGVTPIIRPKCNSAAIISWGNINEKIADTKIIGRWRVLISCRMISTVSKPSICGICTSIKARANSFSITFMARSS